MQSHKCPAARVPGVGACRAPVDEDTAGKRPAGPCPEAGPVSLLSSAGAALHLVRLKFCCKRGIKKTLLVKGFVTLPFPFLVPAKYTGKALLRLAT